MILIFTLDLTLDTDHDLKTYSAILIYRPISKSHKINFGATSVKYPYIQPGHKIHIQAPILLITKYYETSPNDNP